MGAVPAGRTDVSTDRQQWIRADVAKPSMCQHLVHWPGIVLCPRAQLGTGTAYAVDWNSGDGEHSRHLGVECM